MAGKKIVAIAARADSSTALCDDGMIYQWGGNGVIFDWGGSHYTVGKATPTLVDAGALKDKKVVAITGGLALCADGSVVTWLEGMGNPEVVDATGVLKGKTVVKIADPETALCADGTAVSWKARPKVGLGQGDKPDAPTSIERDDPGRVLRGKTIVNLAENVVFCSDDSAFFWGRINSTIGGPHRVTPLTIFVRSNTNIFPVTQARGNATNRSTQAPVPLMEEATPIAAANADSTRTVGGDNSGSWLWIMCADGTLGFMSAGQNSTIKEFTLNGVGRGVLWGEKIIALANGMVLFEERGR
jgi:hypothetical protein